MPRKISIPNPKYFSEYSNESAYIAGFIMADGNLGIRKDNKKYRLQINISKQDINILKWIQSKVFPNHSIIEYQYITANKYVSNLCSLKVSNEQITYDLLKLGIYPNKTGNEHIPSVLPKEYWNSFILGFFDGDGSVSKTKAKSKKEYYRYSLKIVSLSETVLYQIQNHLNIGNIYVAYRKNHKPLFSLEIALRQHIDKFYHSLYDGINHFCLNRKKERIEEFLDRGRLDAKYITAFNKSMKISDWAKEFGIHTRTLRSRMSNPKLQHLSFEEIVSLDKNYRI